MFPSGTKKVGAPGAHDGETYGRLLSEPNFIEKLLHAIKPAVRLGAVLASSPRQRLFQLLNQVNLLLAQMDRGFESNPAHQVARGAATDGFNPLSAESEHPPRLGFLRDLEGHFTR